MTTACRLPESLHARVLAEADRRDVSFNWLVTKLLERHLPAWENQDLEATLPGRS